MSLSIDSAGAPFDLDSVLDRPVFLVGAERSGTTLLRLLLNHHPLVRFHHEFEYVVDHVGEHGEFPRVADFARSVADDRVFQCSEETPLDNVDYPTLAKSFLRAKLGGYPFRVIGATVHRNMERLLYLWPRARFIHLVRDPRDVARSRIAMGWAGNTWVAAEAWIAAETGCGRLRARFRPSAGSGCGMRSWLSGLRPNCRGFANSWACPGTKVCSRFPKTRPIPGPTPKWPGSGGTRPIRAKYSSSRPGLAIGSPNPATSPAGWRRSS